MTDKEGGRVAERLIELYVMNPARVARILDEELDRTGNLLGYLRAAQPSPPITGTGDK